jgi:hypothetical protein
VAVVTATAVACGGSDSSKAVEAPVVIVGNTQGEAPVVKETAEEARPVAPRKERPFQSKLDAPLGLTVTMTAEGISVRTTSGQVAPGCLRLGEGVAVPTTPEGSQDLKALTECARRLKRARPEFAEEEQVTVHVSPGVPYAHVMTLMDALRGEGDEELFPEVSLGAMR